MHREATPSLQKGAHNTSTNNTMPLLHQAEKKFRADCKKLPQEILLPGPARAPRGGGEQARGNENEEEEKAARPSQEHEPARALRSSWRQPQAGPAHAGTNLGYRQELVELLATNGNDTSENERYQKNTVHNMPIETQFFGYISQCSHL